MLHFNFAHFAAAMAGMAYAAPVTNTNSVDCPYGRHAHSWLCLPNDRRDLTERASDVMKQTEHYDSGTAAIQDWLVEHGDRHVLTVHSGPGYGHVAERPIKPAKSDAVLPPNSSENTAVKMGHARSPITAEIRDWLIEHGYIYATTAEGIDRARQERRGPSARLR